MKISALRISKLLFFAFAFTFFLASCKKENSDVINEEIVGAIIPKMKIKIGSRTIEHDAYATYCDKNGKVFFNISNNQVLLDSNLLSSDFRVDDFLINYEKDGTDVLTLGGASFTENVGGVDITSVVFDPAATITILEANSQYVKGSMKGVFQLLSGNQATYTVEFTAKVIRVSPWCD